MPKLSKARQNLVDMYIKCLDENKLPSEILWEVETPKNALTGIPYKGINTILLSMVSVRRKYNDSRWCTFKQMKDSGWKFKGNAKGSGVLIEYWGMYNYKQKKMYTYSLYHKYIVENPKEKDDFKTTVHYSIVFNGDLIEGIPKETKVVNSIKPSIFISNIIQNIHVGYLEYGNQAGYNVEKDLIILPSSSSFKNQYSYYAVQLHELCHATGHPSRLDRSLGVDDEIENYAREELRAEISSSFLMQKLRLKCDQTNLNNHKSYIQSWIKILTNKPQELFDAIAASNKIVDYLEENSILQEKKVVKINCLEKELEYE